MKGKPSLIHHFLESSAESFPDSVAVVYDKKRESYSQINRLANRVAHGLIESGVMPGDRVVLICENGLEYIFCYYGILKAGGIAVPLNTELKPESIQELLGELRPRALMTSAKFDRLNRAVGMSRLDIQLLYVTRPGQSGLGARGTISSLRDLLSSQPDRNLDLEIDPRTCAMIVYTSGSAGRPKGAMLTHANIVVNTRSIVEYLNLTCDDVQMVVLPFFYVMGKSLLNTHFAVGGSLVKHFG